MFDIVKVHLRSAISPYAIFTGSFYLECIGCEYFYLLG